MKKTIAAFLVLATPALAQAIKPPANGQPLNQPLTGAIDAPKHTTSGDEHATTDAAGVPQGTVGGASPSSDTNATAATARRHHHRSGKPHA